MIESQASSLELLLVTAIMGAWVAAALFVVMRRQQNSADRKVLSLPLGSSGPSGTSTPVDTKFSFASFRNADAQGEYVSEILEEMTVPVWRRDAELNLVFVNAAYSTLVGAQSRAEVIARQVELSPSAKSFAAKARDDGQTTLNPDRVALDGRLHMMEIINIPVSRGETFGLVIDGTARHQANNQNVQKIRLFEESLELLGEAVAMFNADGYLTFYNASFAHLFRLDSEWLTTQAHLSDLFNHMYEQRRLPESSDFVRWRDERLQWLKLERESVIEMWLLSSGEMLQVRAHPQSDDGLMLIIADQTEIIKSAGERSLLLARHQAILDHLEEGIVVFAPDCTIRLFNKKASQVFVVPPDFLDRNPTADTLIDHVEKYLKEPERAKNLKMLIMSATTGREERAGTIRSTLGYVVSYKTVPLPDGNALLSFSSFKIPEPDAGSLNG